VAVIDFTVYIFFLFSFLALRCAKLFDVSFFLCKYFLFTFLYMPDRRFQCEYEMYYLLLYCSVHMNVNGVGLQTRLASGFFDRRCNLQTTGFLKHTCPVAPLPLLLRYDWELQTDGWMNHTYVCVNVSVCAPVRTYELEPCRREIGYLRGGAAIHTSSRAYHTWEDSSDQCVCDHVPHARAYSVTGRDNSSVEAVKTLMYVYSCHDQEWSNTL